MLTAMKKPTKTFGKNDVKQISGAQLSVATGGVTGWDPYKKKEILGNSGG